MIALATVLHDFAAEVDGDLTLKAGTVVQVVEKEESGWWRGKYDGGAIGVFPSNFVEVISATEQLAEVNRRERERARGKRNGGGGSSFNFDSMPKSASGEFGALKEGEVEESEVGSVVEGASGGDLTPVNKVSGHKKYSPPKPPIVFGGVRGGGGGGIQLQQTAVGAAVLNASIKPCERHKLMNCVLCSLNSSISSGMKGGNTGGGITLSPMHKSMGGLGGGSGVGGGGGGYMMSQTGGGGGGRGTR